MEQNDQQIVDRICRGEVAAFQILVERYKRKIYYLAYDMLGDQQEAEDVSQDVFIKIFRSLKNFRRDAKMSSWIHQITTNTCIDVLRKRKAKPQTNLEDFDQIPLPDNPAGTGSRFHSPEASAEASLLQSKINEALVKVTPRERTVFVMRHYNDLKIDEIASALSVSSGTVKSLLFRALKKLRKEMSSYKPTSSMEGSYGRL